MIDTLIIFIDANPNWESTIRRAKDLGYTVASVCSSRYHEAYLSIHEQADIVHICATNSVEELFAYFGMAKSIAADVGILSSNDGNLNAVAKAAHYAGLKFTSQKGVSLARNKGAMRIHLEKLGFASPAFAMAPTVQSIAAGVYSVDYPCIVKPASGHLSWFCYRLDDDRDLDRVLAELQYVIDNIDADHKWALENGFLIEEWLCGPVISVPVLAGGGSVLPLCLAIGTTTKEAPCSGFGSVIPYRNAPEVEMAASLYAEKIAVALGLDIGVFDLEMIWTNCGPVIIEANARRMGGVMPDAYELATGVSFDDLLLDAYLGKPVKEVKSERSTTAVIRKLITVESGIIDDRVASGLPVSDRFILRNYSIQPGFSVDRLDVVGRCILVGSNPDDLFQELDLLTADIETIIGVKLAKGELPDLSTEAYKRAALAFINGESRLSSPIYFNQYLT